MALISVTKESLVSVLENYEMQFLGHFDTEEVARRADYLLNYCTPVVPVSPLLPKPSAFAIRDVISGGLVHNFSFCLTERECRTMRLKYFPTAQYQVVKLYEVAE